MMSINLFKIQIVLLIILFTINNLAGQSSNSPQPQGGEYVHKEKVECISEEHRLEIMQRLDHNVNQLRKKGKLDLKSHQVVALDWPLRMISNEFFNDYYTISNYMDHNPSVGPNGWNQYGNTNLDFTCGNRTYDTNGGYNHQGVDISLWPFSWFMYENNIVEVVSAAEGTIIGKDDGHSDANCSCSGAWNAIYIMHNDGSVAWYGHIKAGALTTKNIGDPVIQGEYLGIVASSGCSTGPHLHFELYDNALQLVDPYGGPCNPTTQNSWWSNEKPYSDPTLNALLTHSGPPNMSNCYQNQTAPNISNCFNPGQTIYTVFYYRDQVNGDVVTMRLRDPQGNVYSTWNQTFNANYNSSYWYWYWNLPSSGPYGTWNLEADFKGVSHQYSFSYSQNPCNCPISYTAANGNNLSGITAVNGTYSTFGNIESTHHITNNAFVAYSSGNAICLENGFEIEMGSTLQIDLDGCKQ